MLMDQDLYRADIRNPPDMHVRTGQSMWLLVKYVHFFFRVSNHIS